MPRVRFYGCGDSIEKDNGMLPERNNENAANVDANLKRVYRSDLARETPDIFSALLGAIRAAEEDDRRA